MLKLWLLEADTSGYDRYSKAVVAAADFASARAIHPCSTYAGEEWWADDQALEAWTFPRNVRATQIGEATLFLQPGTVLCASFHAG